MEMTPTDSPHYQFGSVDDVNATATAQLETWSSDGE